MTPRAELIAQLENRLPFLMGRIQFHTTTRQALIDEAARVQAEIDMLTETQGEDVTTWNVNAANEGQD